jgi:hypothetical protein
MRYFRQIFSSVFIILIILINNHSAQLQWDLLPNAAQMTSSINSSYQISYSLSTGNKAESGKLTFSTIINGDDYLFDNGTIQYTISENITSPLLITALSTFFPSEIMALKSMQLINP